MVFKSLSEVCILNRFPQLDANTLSCLNVGYGNVKLLPSSKNYDWFTSEDSAKEYICDGEVITLGRARYSNIKYWKGKFVSSNNVVIEAKNQNELLCKYLYYFLLFNEKNFYVESTTYPKFDSKIFKDTIIPIPSLIKQKEIVRILDTISDSIERLVDEHNKLENSITSRFYEMFGDPEANPYGWETMNISKILNGKTSNGFFAKSDEYSDDGNVQVLGVANVVNRMYSGVEDLPKAYGTQNDINKYKVKYGDMLFCRSSLVAEGIGKASIVPKTVDDNVLFECHVIRIQIDLNKCVPEFLQVFSTTDYFRKQIIAQSKTSTMTTISQDGVLKANILLPPMDKQLLFYNFIKQIGDLMKINQKQVKGFDELLKTTMEECFGDNVYGKK